MPLRGREECILTRKFSLLEFLQGFIKYFLVHLKTYFCDEAALLGAQYVSRSAYIEVAHGNVEAAANF